MHQAKMAISNKRELKRKENQDWGHDFFMKLSKQYSSKHEYQWTKCHTLETAPGLTLLSTLHRMRPLRRARQNSSSVGSLDSASDAPWSICLSHSAA